MSLAIVVGAGRGFGLEAARGLGERGHEVVLADIDRDNLEAGKGSLNESGIDCEIACFDARDYESVSVFGESITDRWSKEVGVVVSMVGGSLGTPRWLSQLKEEHVRPVVDLCVAPGWNIAQTFRSSLKKDNGAIVFVSSSAARLGDRLGWSPVYAFSKGAVLGLARYLSCAPDWEGVRVSAVCPGDVTTERTDEIHQSGIMDDFEVEIVHKRRNMLRRMASPEEIGEAITCLGTNTFVSGAILDINGGEFPAPA